MITTLWVVIGFLIFALLMQIGLFFYIRKQRKTWKKNDILSKYNINSRGDLFRTLVRQDLDEQDREKLETLYQKTFSGGR